MLPSERSVCSRSGNATLSWIVIVTHHIDTARTIPDYIGLIFARHLVKFGKRKDMFGSSESVVKQFLTGSTDGPIGMSEEKDAAEGAGGSGAKRGAEGAEGGSGGRRVAPPIRKARAGARKSR